MPRRQPCHANRSSFPLRGRWPGTRGMLTHHLDEGIASSIASIADGASILDLGAGAGMYGAFFDSRRRAGSPAPREWVGLDGSPDVETYTRTHGPPGALTRELDICRGVRAESAGVNVDIDSSPSTRTEPAGSPLVGYDWVMSLEVGEHLPSECLGRYLALIHAANSRGVLLSWAPPGQDGHCHISTRSEWVVRRAFALLGYQIDDARTQAARRRAERVWFRKNFMVFARRTPRAHQRGRAWACAGHFSFRPSALDVAAACLVRAEATYCNCTVTGRGGGVREGQLSARDGQNRPSAGPSKASIPRQKSRKKTSM